MNSRIIIPYFGILNYRIMIHFQNDKGYIIRYLPLLLTQHKLT